MKFHIRALTQHGSIPFQDYKQFIELHDQSSIEEREKLVEFYMHNLTLIDMNVRYPNAKLGDLQLMALASWMTHEEARDEEVHKIMEKEEK